MPVPTVRILINRLQSPPIQDCLGFWIPNCGFRIPGTGFQYLSVELVFWIPIVIRVPDSKVPDSGIHGKNFPDSLLWVEINFMTQFL